MGMRYADNGDIEIFDDATGEVTGRVPAATAGDVAVDKDKNQNNIDDLIKKLGK